MKNVRLLSIAAASLAAGTAFIATTVTTPETVTRGGIDIPPAPRPVHLVCGPEMNETMGESTAGIEQESTPPVLVASAFVRGGADPTLDGQPLDESGDVATYAGDVLPTNLYVEAGEVPGAGAGTLSRSQEIGELAGLAWIQCVPLGQTHTIVGGSTSLSQSTQLVLTNGSTTPSQVTIEALTSTGVAPATPISTVNVDANSTEVVLLETGVLDERIALSISVTGGLVGAQAYTHGVEGITGTGVAVVSAGAEPSTTQVVSGVDFEATDGANRLRIANPNTEPATVTASVVTSEETQIPGIVDVEVAPGTVLDLTLEGIEESWAGIGVESDLPVAASVGVTGETDIAWIPATPSTTRGMAALGEGESRLNLTTQTAGTVTVTTFDDDGNEIDSRDVNVSRFTTLVLDDDVAFVEAESETAFHGTVFATHGIGDDTAGIEAIPLTIPPTGTAKLDAIVSN